MTDKKAQINECLKRVNDFRAIHDVPPLTLNRQLTAEAQKWAETLADKDCLEHSPKETRISGEGENLSGFTGNQDIVTAFDRWYAEEKDYDYKKNKFVSNAGNFTQLVWANTKEMGLGWAKSNTGWTYVCARFNPTGNIVVTPPGEEECMKENVKKPNRREAKSLKKQMEQLNFHTPTKDEISSFVAELNSIRSDHQVKALEHSKDLQKAAQKWADHLAKQDKPENSSEQDQGECLFSYSGPSFELKTALKVWYGGKEKYDFNNPGFKPGSGNFTQLVWADSKEMGIAASEAKSGKIYVVARFKPSGNIIMTPPGERETFNRNVLVRKAGSR